MSTDYLTICVNCLLVYRPDPRVFPKAHEICPRCGHRIEENCRVLKGEQIRYG